MARLLVVHLSGLAGDDDTIDKDSRDVDIAQREHVLVVTRLTCTITIPPEFLVAWPIKSESSVAGSRSHRHVGVLVGGCAEQERHVEWVAR